MKQLFNAMFLNCFFVYTAYYCIVIRLSCLPLFGLKLHRCPLLDCSYSPLVAMQLLTACCNVLCVLIIHLTSLSGWINQREHCFRSHRTVLMIWLYSRFWLTCQGYNCTLVVFILQQTYITLYNNSNYNLVKSISK